MSAVPDDPTPEPPPLPAPPLPEAVGHSPLAGWAENPWTARGKRRGGDVFGLCVHTTGSGVCNRAWKAGGDVFSWAIDYYCRTGGTHYIVGYHGQIVQVGDEWYQARGVGMTEQIASIRAGRFHRDLSATAVKHWLKAWPGLSSPLDLFPGSSANQAYVHVELPPCIWHNTERGRREFSAPRHSHNSRYTRAQHDAIVELACDIARRHQWPSNWFTTSRLLGHEDLSPLTRSTSSGGWDPGALREQPRFDWGYVRSEIAGKLAVT